jgi:hypothetical protein
VDRARQTEMAKSFLARDHARPVLLLPNALDTPDWEFETDCVARVRGPELGYPVVSYAASRP